MLRPVDTTLESNLFTAFVPSPGLLDRTKHLADGTVGSAWRGIKSLFNAKPVTSFDGIRPPGEVKPSEVGADLRTVAGGNLAQVQLPNLSDGATLSSGETWRDLPLLPLSEVEDVQRYGEIIGLAQGPTSTGGAPVQDAFAVKVPDRNGHQRDLLPPTVLNSSLVNASAKAFKDQFGSDLPARGNRRDGIMTHLWDGKTGFSAGIGYDPATREMTIAFPGLGASRSAFAQAMRSAMNWLGFVPKNMSQASKLTQLVKAHVDALNRDLPPDQQIKLTLAGHSMGGGLASYAALRNKVPAVVMNPMRLGWGARARIGQSRLDEADKYLTEVVAQGDWVADNDASKLYLPLAPVFNSRGPLGNARRFMVPGYGESSDYRHNALGDLAGRMVTHHKMLEKRAPALLAHLLQTSPKARGDLMRGKLAPAVEEAIGQGTAGLRMTSAQRRYIAKLVATLISGRSSDNRPLNGNDIAGLRSLLAKQLDSVEQANPGKELPRVLKDIKADFITKVPPVVQRTFASRDTQTVQRFKDLKRDYEPGGQKFEDIMAKLDWPEAQLFKSVLASNLAVSFDVEFGEFGEKTGSNDAETQAKAGKVLMSVVADMLKHQKGMVMEEDEQLDALIAKAEEWARNGVPVSPEIG